MIVAEGLSKTYGSVRAVNDVSFTVQPGRVTGFLGPNGAGKTTTLRMSTGLVKADVGRTLFDGMPYGVIEKPLHRVGVVLEPVIFHPGRTALDHLLMIAPYARVPRQRCEEVLGLVGLSEVADKRVGKFSLGMRGRLNLAAGLLGDPDILLLDEPVNGLDPEGIRWIRELLRSLAGQGRTILVSSHLLSEMQQTVDEVVIIAHGKLIYEGSLASLEASTSSVVEVDSSQPEAVLAYAQTRGWAVKPGRPKVVTLEGPTPEEVAAGVVGAGIPLSGLTTQTIDLESIFLQMTEGQGAMR